MPPSSCRKEILPLRSTTSPPLTRMPSLRFQKSNERLDLTTPAALRSNVRLLGFLLRRNHHHNLQADLALLAQREEASGDRTSSTLILILTDVSVLQTTP